MSPRDDAFDDLVGFNAFDDLVGFDDLINKGDSLLSWGSYTAAIAKFDEALRLDPESALALHKRGQCYAKKKDDARALSLIHI